MKGICLINSLFFLLLVSSCGNSDSSSFPLGKKFWTHEDYTAVNNELVSLKLNNKELPNLDNPKTVTIFQKIVDTNNFSIVANDSQLGLEYRKEFTSNMFDHYRQLAGIYTETDRSDKYKYPLELIEIEKFGLALQIYYIEIGNQNIIKNADNPNSPDVIDITTRNRNILIKNYTLYLENINQEDRFTEKALTSYSEGIKEFFPRVISDVAPNGDYSQMLDKIDNMLKKSKNSVIIAQLENIQSLIKNKTITTQ